MKRYLLVLGVALIANATSSMGTIKGFRMHTCAAEICTQVDAPEALQGQWGLITFNDIRVEQITGNKVQVFEGHDAVYDVGSQTLAIRQVTRGPAKDLLMDLVSGHVQLFNPPNRGVALQGSGIKSGE